MDRPMINVYEPDAEGVEQLVYRPMNDEEFAQWEADVAAHEAYLKAEVEKPHPLIEQIASLSEADKAAIKELLA